MKRIAIGVIAAMLAAAGLALAGDRAQGRVAVPEIAIAKPGTCVAPTADMRRNHMKYLLHQRDLTVHEGVRDPRFSLKRCVDCHAGRESGSVLGKDGFCASCHAYASVSIDCFECHSPMREARVAARP
jgi:[DsrC]-trisulfide reductase subunit J